MPGFFISNLSEEFTLDDSYAGRCAEGNIKNCGFSIKRSTLDKFMDDKLFEDDDDIIIITEGIFLNKKTLCGEKTWFNTVKEMALSDETNYFDCFRGNFSGAHYNKKTDRWVIYSDALGTQPIYYYNNNNKWIVASEVRYITDALKKLHLKYTPDLDAAYDILSYGFMTTDATLVKEIRRLPYGCYMTIDDEGISVSRYFDFNYHEGNCDMSEDEIIDRIDALFKEAVRLEFEKDNEYGYKHIATLSGGLDSRMTVWNAAEMGYPMLNITFGQSDCMDEKIAKKVAKHLKTQFMTNSLDNGDMLLVYEPVIKMNGGQSLYSGISHSYLTLEKINFNKYGLLHTGDVGDAIVGAFSVSAAEKYPGAYSTKLAHKTKSTWDGKENIEKFKMRTRGLLGVGASKAVCENFAYCISPFMYRDLFVFCLEKIPYDMRSNHYIYKKWVLSKHNEAAKLPLQRYNGGLMTEGKLLQTIRKVKRIGIVKLFDWLLCKVHIKKTLSRKIVKTSMNPLDLWFFGERLEIKETLDTRFQTGITELSKSRLINDEFADDLINLYNSGIVTEKTQAITVIEALEQLFAD